jgi:FKBP-type peptidyl-prolyl cis-trans isomerase SlyD
MSSDTTSTDGTFEPGEFVELEYTATAVESGLVIDTTDPSVAADADLADIEADGPIVIVLGEGHVFEPVEDALATMGPDEHGTVQVAPADAFGEVDPTRRQTVDIDVLGLETVEQNDRVSVDGRVGYVDTVADDTVTVDFNHPLAGATIEYDLKTGDRVEELDGQVAGLLRLHGLGDDVSQTIEEGVITCSVNQSSPPTDDWSDRKRQFLESATAHLDVDVVRFEERYAIR